MALIFSHETNSLVTGSMHRNKDQASQKLGIKRRRGNREGEPIGILGDAGGS